MQKETKIDKNLNEEAEVYKVNKESDIQFQFQFNFMSFFNRTQIKKEYVNKMTIPGGPPKRNSRYSQFLRTLLWSTVIFFHLAG